MSFCGSIAYLAPEMIQRKGHGKAVDWYLLGVLIYEMLTGIPPFYSKNRKSMIQNIMYSSIKVPTYVSKEAQNLLLLLLSKEPQKRLGAGELDAKEIKRHPWFSSLSWKDVFARKLPVPQVRRKETLQDLDFEIASNLMPADRMQMRKQMHEVNVTIEDWSFQVSGNLDV